ncbi:MAG: HAMP domain-containing histidine kinase [Anaerolineaceae bacterium]|nr:HAMP domain-containing histidine kinase [Anaerolineaceae bacterium]
MMLKKLLFRKLKWELAGILGLVVILTVVLNSLFSLWATNEGFEIYVSGENRQDAEFVAPLLEKYYTYQGSWDGLNKLLEPQAEETMYVSWSSDIDWMQVAAQTIGVDEETLYTVYDQNLDIADVARAHDIEPETIIQNIMDAEQAEIDQAVAAGFISPEDAHQNMILTQAFATSFVLSSNTASDEEFFNFLYTPDVVNLLLSTLYFEDQRLVVVSAGGFVVYDSLTDENNNILGSHLEDHNLDIGVPLYDEDRKERIGTVIVGSFSGIYGPQQKIFLDKINRSFLFSGLLASIIGAAIGIWTSQRITAPVMALSEAARNLAERNQPVKLPVKSDDELGQMASSFNLMVDALEEQRALRSRLFNDVAHELNTPLSVIQLELNALQDGLQTPADAASQMQQEVEHLKNIIKDLIWLSETDEGEMQLDFRPLDLLTETRRLVEHWRFFTMAQEVELFLQIDPALEAAPAWVNVDSFRLEQVFRNILDNALRYTEAGGKIVVTLTRARTACLDREVDCLVTSIHDTGQGIPEEDLPHIFERFYRVDPSRSRQNGGRGLGLAIVRHIIEGHGGKVWAESQISKGTTIAYALPCISSTKSHTGSTPGK